MENNNIFEYQSDTGLTYDQLKVFVNSAFEHSEIFAIATSLGFILGKLIEVNEMELPTHLLKGHKEMKLVHLTAISKLVSVACPELKKDILEMIEKQAGISISVTNKNDRDNAENKVSDYVSNLMKNKNRENPKDTSH